MSSKIFALENIRKRGFYIGQKIFAIMLGAVLIATAYNALIIPHGILTGGAGGIALIGEYVLGVPVHIGFILINLPIFIWGIKELSWEFIFYSLIGSVVLIVALPLTSNFIPVPELDIFLASLFSGLVSGLGIGIVIKFGASTGGSDIFAVIMKKKHNISVGAFTFYFNVFVLLLSVYFFDLKTLLYTVISMGAAAKATNSVLEGINKHKSVMIISENNDAIANRVIEELRRGVTYLEGYGAYSGQKRKIINCVVNHFEIAKLREIVEEEDEKAFMFITETVEVSGKGFTIPLN